MPAPVSFYSQTILDNTVKSNGAPESAVWAVPIPTLTTANYVATKTLIDNLSAAVAGVIRGNTGRSEIVFERLLLSRTPAGSQLAQREEKLLCRYHDQTTGIQFRVSIPTFNLSLLPNHSEFLDLTTGVGLALKTAFEAVVVSPDDASHVTVLDSAQYVGRNS